MLQLIEDLQLSINDIQNAKGIRPRIEYVYDKQYNDRVNEELANLVPKIDAATEVMDSTFLLIGGLLCQVKELLPHGHFGEFVDTHFRFTSRHANNFMVAYKVVADYPTLKSLNCSLLKTIGSKNFPEELKKLLADSISGAIDMTNAELKALQNAFMNGDLIPESNKFLQYLQNQDKSYIRKIWADKVDSLMSQLSKEAQKMKTTRDNQLKTYTKGLGSEIDLCWEAIDDLLKQTFRKFEEKKGSLLKPHVITHKFIGDAVLKGHSRTPRLGETLFNLDKYKWTRFTWMIEDKYSHMRLKEECFYSEAKGFKENETAYMTTVAMVGNMSVTIKRASKNKAPTRILEGIELAAEVARKKARNNTRSDESHITD